MAAPPLFGPIPVAGHGPPLPGHQVPSQPTLGHPFPPVPQPSPDNQLLLSAGGQFLHIQQQDPENGGNALMGGQQPFCPFGGAFAGFMPDEQFGPHFGQSSVTGTLFFPQTSPNGKGTIEFLETAI